MKFCDLFLKFYGNKYFLGPLVLTLLCSVILFSPYSSNNDFDLIKVFFSCLAVVSALILAVFLQHLSAGKKDFGDLFSISLISMLLSIMTIGFCKTYSFLAHFSSIFMIAATFAFFTIFKEAINKFKLDN